MDDDFATAGESALGDPDDPEISMPPMPDKRGYVNLSGEHLEASDLAFLAPEAEKSMVNPGTLEFEELCRRLDHRSRVYVVAKRVFDILFSAFVLAVGLIPGAILAVAIAADTKGSPIYSQKRLGRLGRSFRIYKFRSMVADADNVEKYFTPEQLAVWHCERKVDNDPRITRLGEAIRKTSIDELPNFWNVLRGEMSTIGPRAMSREEIAWFGKNAAEVLSVPAGITGWWQVQKRNEATFESGERQSLELEYVRNSCLKIDVRVFFKTFSAMFGKKRNGQ